MITLRIVFLSLLATSILAYPAPNRLDTPDLFARDEPIYQYEYLPTLQRRDPYTREDERRLELLARHLDLDSVDQLEKRLSLPKIKLPSFGSPKSAPEPVVPKPELTLKPITPPKVEPPPVVPPPKVDPPKPVTPPPSSNPLPANPSTQNNGASADAWLNAGSQAVNAGSTIFGTVWGANQASQQEQQRHDNAMAEISAQYNPPAPTADAASSSVAPSAAPSPAA